MSFFNRQELGELVEPGLERRSFSTWLNDSICKVVTNAIRSWGVTGCDNTLIAEAVELYDKTGMNTLVAYEAAAITQPSPDGIHRKRGLFNAVFKGRMDWEPQGPRRDEPNSIGFFLSAQPEIRAESVCGADPDTLFGPAINIAGNPDASLCRMDSQMRWIRGEMRECIKVETQHGVRWLRVLETFSVEE